MILIVLFFFYFLFISRGYSTCWWLWQLPPAKCITIAIMAMWIVTKDQRVGRSFLRRSPSLRTISQCNLQCCIASWRFPHLRLAHLTITTWTILDRNTPLEALITIVAIVMRITRSTLIDHLHVTSKVTAIFMRGNHSAISAWTARATDRSRFQAIEGVSTQFRAAITGHGMDIMQLSRLSNIFPVFSLTETILTDIRHSNCTLLLLLLLLEHVFRNLHHSFFFLEGGGREDFFWISFRLFFSSPRNLANVVASKWVSCANDFVFLH